MKQIVFASGNKGKIAEVTHLFENTDIKVVSLYDLGDVPDIVEDGETFEDNAKIKAEFIFKRFGLPVIADDSGLVVEQLNGEPGVYSARYAGENCTFEDNNNKLIAALSEFPEPHIAKFVCCAVYMDKDKYFCEIGEAPGRIIKEVRGKLGFGYDPIFIPESYDKTLAEMDISEKNTLSHRSRAFSKLKRKILKE